MGGDTEVSDQGQALLQTFTSSSSSSSNQTPASVAGQAGGNGFSPEQMQQLSAMISSIVIQTLGTSNVNSALSGQSSSSPQQSGQFTVPSGASSAVSSSSSTGHSLGGLASSHAGPTQSGTSAGVSGTSYSGALAHGIANSSTQAALLAPTAGLYGNQEKLPSHLPPLKPLPRCVDFDSWEKWSMNAINNMSDNAGMRQVCTILDKSPLTLLSNKLRRVLQILTSYPCCRVKVMKVAVRGFLTVGAPYSSWRIGW